MPWLELRLPELGVNFSKIRIKSRITIWDIGIRHPGSYLRSAAEAAYDLIKTNPIQPNISNDIDNIPPFLHQSWHSSKLRIKSQLPSGTKGSGTGLIILLGFAFIKSG
jgi:hypothetical protein